MTDAGKQAVRAACRKVLEEDSEEAMCDLFNLFWDFPLAEWPEGTGRMPGGSTTMSLPDAAAGLSGTGAAT